MKFGVNTFIWAANVDRSILDLLPVIRQRGFDGVEMPLIQPAQFPVAEVRRGLASSGLECTFCSVLPQGMNAISEDPAVRRKTAEHLAECARVAAETGGKILAGPLYSPVGYLPGRRRSQSEWNWAVECYQSLGDTLESCGVTVALEPLNRFETYFLNTAADAVRLCARIHHPNVGILFDTFHANVEEKDVAAALRATAPYLKHVHASENDRGTPGTGHVDWKGVFQVLDELRYGGWLTIESFGFALGELSSAASIWRDLAPSPESIAFDGLEFLKARQARRG